MNVHRPVHGVRDLSRLFRPRSIALIGGSVATAAALQCRRMGFAGEVWRVHPTKSEDEGFPCVPDVASLPGVPDAVFLGINRALTVDVVAQLSRLGAGGVVCYASGFSESGEEGAGFTARLLEAAGSMPLMTLSTWAPQPAQVVFWQRLHFTGRHMGQPTFSRH